MLLAFERYVTGEFSDTTTTDLLNREGYPPSGRARSGRWTREGVRYVLTNRFYLGEVQHGDRYYPGRYELLAHRETWDQVQAIQAGHLAEFPDFDPALLKRPIGRLMFWQEARIRLKNSEPARIFPQDD